MGQGLTGTPGTYSRLKDIVNEYILALHKEPELLEVNDNIVFRYYLDDDFGSSPNFKTLYNFLHY